MKVSEYLEKKAEYKAALKKLKDLKDEVENFEEEHKLELKSYFDISLSSKASRVVLNKDFKIVRSLKLKESVKGNGFNYVFKGVDGRISFVDEYWTEAGFRVTCGLNAK